MVKCKLVHASSKKLNIKEELLYKLPISFASSFKKLIMKECLITHYCICQDIAFAFYMFPVSTTLFLH